MDEAGRRAFAAGLIAGAEARGAVIITDGHVVASVSDVPMQRRWYVAMEEHRAVVVEILLERGRKCLDRCSMEIVG